MPAAEIVEHHGLESRANQRLGRVTADVAGPAGHQYSHGSCLKSAQLNASQKSKVEKVESCQSQNRRYRIVCRWLTPSCYTVLAQWVR